MATWDFKLPDIGEGVVEGEIVKWLVKAGDEIKEDQPMVEVMTDKATVTIPSPKKGKVLKTFGKEGEIAKVHHPLVQLELDGAAPAAPGANGHGTNGHAPAPAAPAAAAAPAASAAAPASASGSKVLATPVTRRMAREHGIDLGILAGTGPQGRVLKSDVEAALKGGGAAAPAAARPAIAHQALAVSKGDTRIPIRGLRKKIAEKMVKAKFTAPHYTFVEEIDATGLVNLRTQLNETLRHDAVSDVKISFLPFFCKALVAAFKKYPQLNANMDEATQDLVQKGDVNIGIAAATDDGLTVPVVKHVDRLTLKELASEIARLGTAAREKKLKMEELTGGGFTITSLGQTGGLFATPIINHPEVAIMGVHRMRKRPVVVGDDDRIEVRQMMYLSFSFDHRVIDGAVGADFAYEVIKYLQAPANLMLEMS
ncbi:MAG: 2-oxo acid dehydrogenase subunit E2 [Myxococcaceae bacterium]|nr:2-oxo acid dehydrogenase subunit E2 [Myxococcaceae bacterium]